MQNIEEFYILGLPIQTDIGDAHFIKIKDYPDYFAELQAVGMSRLEIIHRYKELNKNGEMDEILNELEKSDLYDMSVGLPDLRLAYYKVFSKVFGDDEVVSKINKENFEFYRNLVMRMNYVKEEEINPNPEIQRAIERSRRVKQQNQEKMTFSDICSSIVVQSSNTYNDILEMTIPQFFTTYYRIGQFKNYDTSTLFATVAEKVDIESWSKHIDLFQEENHFISESEFKNKTGSVFED